MRQSLSGLQLEYTTKFKFCKMVWDLINIAHMTRGYVHSMGIHGIKHKMEKLGKHILIDDQTDR